MLNEIIFTKLLISLILIWKRNTLKFGVCALCRFHTAQNGSFLPTLREQENLPVPFSSVLVLDP